MNNAYTMHIMHKLFDRYYKKYYVCHEQNKG